MRHLDAYLLLNSGQDSYAQAMGLELREFLTLLRGLPKSEYAVTIQGVLDSSPTVVRYGLSAEHFPMLVLDGEILAAGGPLSPDAASDLLRLGCADAEPDSTCCRDADPLRERAAVVQTAMPNLVGGLFHDARARLPSDKPAVLFVCRHNSCRSQMAEGFLRDLAGDRFEVLSCGLAARPVEPLAVKAMAEVGIDIGAQKSRNCGEIIGGVPVQYAIFVCHVAEEQCPAIYPFATRYLRWPFEDPTTSTGSNEQRLEVFRHVRDEIFARIRDWLDKVRGQTEPATIKKK